MNLIQFLAYFVYISYINYYKLRVLLPWKDRYGIQIVLLILAYYQKKKSLTKQN